MLQKIGIKGMGSISALGVDASQVWQRYLHSESLIQYDERLLAQLARLDEAANAKIKLLQQENKHYKALDRSVLLAMFAARQAVMQANWTAGTSYGINIGSSRGATQKTEYYYDQFKEKDRQKFSPLSSPTTTLGNLSYWIGNHLNQQGLRFDHSITCSTALHSVLNGIAWLSAGLSDHFLVGGTEAPLTPFTIAQMKALRIYTKEEKVPYPCRALDFAKSENTMVLGEAAACFALSKDLENCIAFIEGFGFASEPLKHPTSISEAGDSLYESMKLAIKEVEKSSIDLIVCHSPGTCQGDLAEWKAIERLFDKNIPVLTTNKWKIGHTLGASGAMSMELAILMLQKQSFISCPTLNKKQKEPSSIQRVLVNAIGFGGNAVSILLGRNA